LQNEPLGHGAAEEELTGQYCCSTHAVGNTERKGQKLPASHIKLTVVLRQNEPSAHGESHVDPAGQKLPKLQARGADDEIDLQKYPSGHVSQRNPFEEYDPDAQGKHGGGMFGIKARVLPAKKEPLDGVIGFT
jgi:hypothetical protein